MGALNLSRVVQSVKRAHSRPAEPKMKNLNNLEKYRLRTNHVREYFGSFGDETCGIFLIPSQIDKADLKCIAAAGRGWDHVSVSRKNRCPNWPEMDRVKRLFFLPSETVVQFHVPEDEHISFHPFTLHLWRSWTQSYNLPPPEWVGPKTLSPDDVRRFMQLPPGVFRELAKKQLLNK